MSDFSAFPELTVFTYHIDQFVLAFIDFRRTVDDVEDPLGSGDGHHHAVELLGEVGYRSGDLPGVKQE